MNRTSLAVFLGVLFSGLSYAEIWFVNENVPPGTPEDGTSWATPYQTIQPAIDAASAGDEVWVARGVYGEIRDNETGSLILKEGVELYGGFAGDETAREQRDFVANESVVDGRFAQPGGTQEAKHVVIGADNTILDGLTVRRGGRSDSRDIGIGIRHESGSMIIRNCRIAENTTISDGGGLFVGRFAMAEIDNCLFEDNAAGEGSAIFIDVGGEVTINDSRLANNQQGPALEGRARTRVTIRGTSFAGRGRGISISSSSVVDEEWLIENCLFRGKGIETSGGGPAVLFMTIRDTEFLNGAGIDMDTGDLTVERCLFEDGTLTTRAPISVSDTTFVGGSLITRLNSAGGIVSRCRFDGTRVTVFGNGHSFVNCLFAKFDVRDAENIEVKNSTFRLVDGLTGPTVLSRSSSLLIQNSIIVEGIHFEGDPPVVEFSSIEGGFPGVGNIDGVPEFRDPVHGNFRVRSDSPTIDGGAILAEITDDLDGVARPQGASHDMGAYEFLDTDGDGIEDAFEVANGLNANDPSDSTSDVDGDGLSAIAEFNIDSDPNDANSPPSDVFVSSAGDDESGDGSEGNPWATVQKAQTEVEHTLETLFAVNPLTIHLAPESHEERVTLLPFVSLEGAGVFATSIEFFDGVESRPVVLCADQSTLSNLTVRLPENVIAPVAKLVEVDNVTAHLENVRIDGRFAPNAIGLVLKGPGSLGTTVTNSAITRVDTGIRSTDSPATVSGTTFSQILDFAVVVGLPFIKSKGVGNELNLGIDGVEGTGSNVFRDVVGLFVLNLGPNVVRAENNDWGFTTEEEIGAKMFGEVDFVPFVGMVVPPEPEPEPLISVQPGARDFGDVEVGDTVDATFTVTNDGEAPLNGSARAPQPFFVVSGSPYNIPVGESVDITIRFAPQGAHEYTGTVIFSGGGGATADVTGTGFVMADDDNDEIPNGMKPAGCAAGPSQGASLWLDWAVVAFVLLGLHATSRKNQLAASRWEKREI